MFFVYAISSTVRKYIYVGLTSDIDERFHRHNSGYEKTTKPYRPYKLIYSKTFITRAEAREFEKYLKSTSGKRFLYSLLESCGH
ncbi:MAG: GIY-YIG nuclease family protein [Cyclobacteriaceae bacterium]|jgi:putative endonuclease|nr:GIY-YIG nuclease family protein [Cyclobacteriaceae bacterium]